MSVAETFPANNSSEFVHQAMAELASTHTETHDFLEVADYDPENELHQLNTVFKEATTGLSSKDAIDLAERVFPGFYETMVEPFLARPRLLDEIEKLKSKGENVALVTAHESLMDIAWTALALNIAISERLLDSSELDTKKTQLVVSRTIASMDFVDGDTRLPATNMMSLTGNLHFTLPDSNRIKQSGISEEVIASNNKKVVRNLLDQTRRGGNIVAIAAPGTVDERLYRELEGVIHLNGIAINHVADTTAKLITRFGNILPVAVDVSGEKKFCIPGKLEKISDQNDIHKHMAHIALTRSHFGQKPVYYNAT